MNYWQPTSVTPDTRTATFSLAVDATTLANGCLRFIPGSHVSKTVRVHTPIKPGAHAVEIKVDDVVEEVRYCEVPRGSVTIHNEYVVHASYGNETAGHRRTYVLAFRTEDTVRRERAVGFDHSHNSPQPATKGDGKVHDHAAKAAAAAGAAVSA